MKLRFGLQARLVIAMTVMLGVVLLVLLLLLQRQRQMREETEALGRDGVHSLVDTYLRDYAGSLARQMAENLANPMYYRDLELIGTVLRDNSRDSLVSYIRVYDLGGNLVHDGSVEIQGYGLPMGDPLAAAAAAARTSSRVAVRVS